MTNPDQPIQTPEAPPSIALAPMEGVMDPAMRALYTNLGGYDLCVTEFIRVTSALLPPSVFLRFCPELRSNGRTHAGVPVFVQLLGGQPGPLAENAARAAELGAPGIDLNFGCPAKTVNRHDGGASLLRHTDRLHGIVSAVRAAVPESIPVTAKLRLGYDDPTVCIENALAVEAGGAAWVTVHARTKMDGYKPPAHWHWLAAIREQLSVPLIANGEIWSVDDAQRCRNVSGCDALMLGRGAIARPDLGLLIAADRQQAARVPLDWAETAPMLLSFYQLNLASASKPVQAASRLKQWLRYLGQTWPEAREWFEALKRERDPWRLQLRLQQGLADQRGDAQSAMAPVLGRAA